MVRAPGQGRKPKPTKQRIAGGNAGKRKINDREPDYDRITDVSPPEWLDELAVAAWDHYAPMLCDREVLTSADLHNLEIFCSAYSRWRQAELDVAQHGIKITMEDGEKKNPACTVINECLRQISTFGSLLGLDPTSRTRIITPDRRKRDNPFTQLLNGQK